LVLVAADLAYHDRLQEADLLDRGLELLQRLFVEDLPGLLRVGDDRLDRDLREPGPRYRTQLVVDRRSRPGRGTGLGRRCRGPGGDEGTQPSPQPTTLLAHPATSPTRAPRSAISWAASK